MVRYEGFVRGIDNNDFPVIFNADNQLSIDKLYTNLIEINNDYIRTIKSPYLYINNGNFGQADESSQLINCNEINIDLDYVINLNITECHDKVIYAQNIICLSIMRCRNVKVILSGNLFGYIYLSNRNCLVNLKSPNHLMPPISKQYAECYQYSQGKMSIIFLNGSLN